MIFEERDLSNFIRAIKELGSEYKLVLLGKDRDMLRKYRQIDDSLIHIEFIPAPDYLLFTSMCHMGIVTYDPGTLNTAYCAPNKIFEYAAFGKPMIANNIPGLKVLSESGAGEQSMKMIFHPLKKRYCQSTGTMTNTGLRHLIFQ